MLDDQFRLLWIGGDWDELAVSKGNGPVRSNDVLSTSYLSHIADEPTKRAVVSLIEAVLAKQEPLRIDYRCDRNSMMRRFQLTIQPMRDHRVLLVHDLRDAQTFDLPAGQWRHDDAAETQKCSFCCSVRAGEGPWVPAESLGADHPEHVCYTMCPDCEARVEDAVTSLRANREPKNPVTSGFGPDGA